MSFKTAIISSIVVLMFLFTCFSSVDGSVAFAAEGDQPAPDGTYNYRWVGDSSNKEIAITGFVDKKNLDKTDPIVIPDTHGISTDLKVVGIKSLAFNYAKTTEFTIGPNLQFIEAHDAMAVKNFKVHKDNDFFTVYDGELKGDYYEGNILMSGGTVVAATVDVATELGKNKCFPDSMTTMGDGAYNHVDFSVAFDNSVFTVPDLTSIPDYAFQCAKFQTVSEESNERTLVSSIKEFVIPDGVMFIGKEAFSGDDVPEVSGVVKITFGNDIYSIGERAFMDRDLFKGELKINALMVLDNAFRNDDGFESLVVGENVAYIGAGAFYSSSIAGVLTIPSTVLYVGPGAFAYCHQLEGLDISAKIISGTPGNGAFTGCEEVTALKLGTNVTYIGDYAFKGCVSMKAKQLVFSDELSYIGDSAFEGCKALNKVTLTFNCQPRAIGYKAFDLGTNRSVVVESTGWADDVFDSYILGDTTVSNFVKINKDDGNGTDISLFITIAVGVICLAAGIGGTMYYMKNKK